jgi:putative MATE family efflux protein
MSVHLGDHFTFKKIFQITIFPISMMVFTSLYSIIDGIFIANFSSESSFAAVNLIFPIIFIVGSIGFIFGTGGSALVAKLLGEQKREKAIETFSLIVYFTIIFGALVSVASFFAIEQICITMGNITESATDEMISEAIKYGKILSLGQVIFMMQNLFQSFFMVNEKSKFGFLFVLAGGLTNMALDALFIGLFKWGVIGAAFATISGYVVAGIGPLIYFIVNKKGLIYLTKCRFVVKDILQAAYNGMSEFVSNISMSIVSIVYNIQLLRAYGEMGVSAYGIIMYVSFVFMAVFIGYSIGIAPVVSYNYGAQNKEELRNIIVKSWRIILIASVLMTSFGMATAAPFARIFANKNEELIALATQAMRIYSIVFLFCGYSIYCSCFFTALNNGTVSAIISFSRTIIFQIGFVYLLPLIFGAIGIWWAIVAGEIADTVVAIVFLVALQKKYGY